MAALKDAIRVGRCYDFLQNSRYVDTTPETWRLAIDAADGEDDVWQCAWKLAIFVHGHVSYESHSTRVHTHTCAKCSNENAAFSPQWTWRTC